MKNYATLKTLPLIITIFIFLVLVGFGTVAFSEQIGTPSIQTAVVQDTAPAYSPDTGTKGAFFSLWWGAGIGVVVVGVILYFAFANMERKTASEFEATIVDDIVSALEGEYSLSKNDLRDLVVGIVATRRCSDSRLTGLLRIEYEVEKTSPSRTKRTTAVAIKRQNDVIVKKATRTIAWEGLPAPIRKEFILKNENLLVYSLYSDNEKED